jgi:hypothetical protein
MTERGTQKRFVFVGKRFGLIIASLLVLLLALTACGAAPISGTSATPTPTVALTATPSATSTPGVTGYPVKVYFSRHPDSDNNSNAVFPVGRVSPTALVAAFAIQLLIAGPTPDERSSGNYFSEFNGLFNGPSQCATGPAPVGGPDFILTQDAQGTATVKFCRATTSAGIGTDARVLAEIRTTLLQFPTIKKVVVLNIGGHCFGDESGQDLCLK